MCGDPLGCMVYRAMVQEMLGETSGLADPAKAEFLNEMMRDQYGNYVVQKTLEVSLCKGCSASHRGSSTLTTGVFSPTWAVGKRSGP